MSEFCPKCESRILDGGCCENGHDVAALADPINPPYYTAGKVECFDAILSAIDGMQAQHAVCVGNVIKYLWRLHRKGDAKENAQKAAWYLERLVRELG